MKRIATALLFVVIAAGCQSPRPSPMPPTVVGASGRTAAAAPSPVQALAAEQASLEQRQSRLEKTMAASQRALEAQVAAQARVEAKLTETRAELFTSTKNYKDRIDALATLQSTNAAAIAQLQDLLKSGQTELKQIAAALASPTAEVAALRKQIDEERSAREAAAKLAQTHAQEIAELRHQLETQERLLKESRKVASTTPSQPPVEAQPTGAGAHQDAEAWVKQGNTVLAAGKPADAQALFESALKVRPAMVPALVGLAACQYARGDYISAAKSADRALDINAGNAQALGVKGLVQRKDRNFSGAVRSLGAAVDADPSDARLRNYYGIALNDRGSPAKAIEQFKRAVEIDPGYAEAHFNLASLLAVAEPPQLDAARDHYRKAVEMGSERDADLDRILGAK